MNRSNLGNVVTNGMQILSVGATTASGMYNASKTRKSMDERRSKSDAASGLNNLSKDEREQYGLMKADKMRLEVSKFYEDNSDLKQNTKGATAGTATAGTATTETATTEGATTNKENNIPSVDDLIAQARAEIEKTINVNSMQAVDLIDKITNDIEFSSEFTKKAREKDIYISKRGEKGKFTSSLVDKKEDEDGE